MNSLLRKISAHLSQIISTGFPSFNRPNSIDSFSDLRAHARSHSLNKYPRIFHPALNLLRLVGWPVILFTTTLQDRKRVADTSFTQALFLGLKKNAHPVELLHATNPGQSLFSSDMLGFYNFLKPDQPAAWVDDKWAFAEFCSGQDLPHPKTCLAQNASDFAWSKDVSTLVLKPRFGSGGRGIIKVARSQFQPKEFTAGSNYLAQALVGTEDEKNCSIRMVTYLDEQNLPQHLVSYGRVKSEFNQPIDLSKPEIEASALPNFQSIVDQILSAHSASGGFRLLGWDILFDNKNYYFLEANQRISLLEIEQVMGVPIGDTEFIIALLEHVKCRS